MKAPIFIGLCAVFSLGPTGTKATELTTALEPEKAQIACAQERGEVLGQCTYRIKRDDKGKITLTVAFPNGFKRGLFFTDGKFVKGSVTMSGVGTDTDWTLKDGMHMIRVDGQRYEVPDALIAGD